jgi:hypothetical protein
MHFNLQRTHKGLEMGDLALHQSFAKLALLTGRAAVPIIHHLEVKRQDDLRIHEQPGLLSKSQCGLAYLMRSCI